ncbi:hypothetical protein AGOR_G00041470 [Albula goreensis]|uniref:Receptor activity-modifying protein 3 n=1 Tax=Albula goreensis TaxID=1534307 RepID=A0A8T3DYF6_9TELE|nr:hypothetical protein AGOR_G00041470 [Albula goreensis]
MDKNALTVFQLFIMIIFVTTLMTSGLSASENKWMKELATPRPGKCNETALLTEMEMCGEMFQKDMMQIDPENWCNITHFIGEYNVFSICTEYRAESIGCYWPNPLVESYIIRVHRHFFSNCTMEQVVPVDPPDDTLTALIAVPMLLTLVMIALVVWRSKRSDLLA